MACSNKRYTRATLQEDELLSEEVKKYPSLYDKKMKDYKDRNVLIDCCESPVARKCNVAANRSRDDIAFRITVSSREMLCTTRLCKWSKRSGCIRKYLKKYSRSCSRNSSYRLNSPFSSLPLNKGLTQCFRCFLFFNLFCFILLFGITHRIIFLLHRAFAMIDDD